MQGGSAVSVEWALLLSVIEDTPDIFRAWQLGVPRLDEPVEVVAQLNCVVPAKPEWARTTWI